ncbi:MAG: 50S ribosomal protein L15 [Syntrophales bacterium]
MNLATLKPPVGSRKKRKRVGRGNASGHGGTSCRGHKGQNARSGGGTRPAFEGGQMPLTRRLPKRGFRNPFRLDVSIVNVGELQRFPQGSLVDEELLVNSGLIKRGAGAFKILGEGNIEHALTLRVGLISRSAREKIVNAGGAVLEVN